MLMHLFYMEMCFERYIRFIPIQKDDVFNIVNNSLYLSHKLFLCSGNQHSGAPGVSRMSWLRPSRATAWLGSGSDRMKWEYISHTPEFSGVFLRLFCFCFLCVCFVQILVVIFGETKLRWTYPNLP